MNAIVNIEDIRGAIREKLIADGCEDDIDTVLSDFEQRVSVTEYEAEE